MASLKERRATFSKRLRERIGDKKGVQQDLAEQIGVSESSVSGWLNKGNLPSADILIRLQEHLNTSIDWLLGSETKREAEYEYAGIRWLEAFPMILPEDQKRFISLGINFFRLTIVHGYIVDEVLSLEEFKGYDIDYVYSAFKAAIHTGIFQFIEIPRYPSIEKELIDKFHLKEVIVAKIPPSNATLISAEIVAFLAARHALASLTGQIGIGLGAGYTMLRFAEYSVPYIEQFRCKWIPLITYNRKGMDYYAANHIAAVMANRHPFSEALFLPHINKNSKADDIALKKEIELAWRHSTTLFYTVNGLGRNRIPNEFRSADGLSSGDLTGILDQLINERREQEIAGEILGRILASNGTVITNKTLEPMYKDVVTHIDFKVLKQISIGHKIWVVGAKEYKANAILAAIQNGLANSLVIDPEIANFLRVN